MIQKIYLGYYQGYHMYDVIDAAKVHHYMASSPYLTEGFVTRVADTEAGLKLEIDKTIARIKLLRLTSRVYNL